MVDVAMAVLLLIVLPIRVVWRERSSVRRSRIARYRSATLIIAGCLGGLALQWAATGRSVALLGLNFPPTELGWACLLGTALLLMSLSIVLRRKPSMASAEDADDPFPQTSGERVGYVLFACVAGSGWEILYRGFLIWFLTPFLGIVAAVGVAGLAYGIAHGVKDRRTLIASIASALVFTTAFAVIRELWWLMLIHTGLPLLALVKPARATTRHV